MDFRLDQNRPVPLHAQIEEYLRSLIVMDNYKSGKDFSPKEVTLFRKLGVARNTIRQAVNKLEHKGLVEREKGVGIKVINRKVSTR